MRRVGGRSFLFLFSFFSHDVNGRGGLGNELKRILGRALKRKPSREITGIKFKRRVRLGRN